jgi:predicted amidohydrolase YtcJ
MTAQPDAVFFNGTVLRLDDARSVASAFAVAAGRFAQVGSDREMLALRGRRTLAVDLGGATVVPGFNDSHNHMLDTGLEMEKVQLGAVRSLAALLAAIARAAATKPDGEWVRCSSAWHESQLDERRLPNRWELDRAAPRHPVHLPRGGHTVVVNSAALALAGIDRSTNPPGGAVIKDSATGEPTGLLFEPSALGLVQRCLPPPTAQRKRAAIIRAMRAFHAAGITSVIEPGLAPDEIDIYRQLRAADELRMRTSCMVGFGWVNWPDPTVANVRALGRFEPGNDGMLGVDGIKLFIDGGIESALMSEPYCLVTGEQEDPTYRGVQVLDGEILNQVVRAANALDWRVGVHAVGDRGIDCVLDAYAAADRERPLRGRRYMLIHGVLPEARHFPRLREMGIAVASQVHHHTLGENMIRYWGRARADRANPVLEYLRERIPVAGGTDSQVCSYEQPLAVWADVTRHTLRGTALGPQLGLSRFDSLALHTRAGSYLTFEEADKGTIEVGKYADFAVLSANPLTCSIDELKETRVLRTVVGGETVWEA